jgi:uncharacterized iron-regulated protein
VAAIKYLAVFLCFTACSVPTQPPSGGLNNPQVWASALYVEHPLVGLVWDTRDQAFISLSKLDLELQRASYLLLGEKHDNPDHHALQLAVLESLLAADTLHSVSFEMLSEESQPNLAIITQQNFASEDELRAFIDWDEQGWNWGFYGPLVELALDSDIDIAAGNISRQRMSAVYGDGELSKQWEFLGGEVLARLTQDINDSHCGMLPESQFPAMVRVQQARDSAMAKSLRPPGGGTVSVLIAGNYHARQDLGVPNYLLREHSDLQRANIISLSFVEVSPEGLDPQQYLDTTADVSAHDFIWFTPAVSNEDYCASMRQGV